jgi:hypothetical protein
MDHLKGMGNVTDKNDVVAAIAASRYASRATDDAIRAEPPIEALADEAWDLYYKFERAVRSSSHRQTVRTFSRQALNAASGPSNRIALRGAAGAHWQSPTGAGQCSYWRGAAAVVSVAWPFKALSPLTGMPALSPGISEAPVVGAGEVRCPWAESAGRLSGTPDA